MFGSLSLGARLLAALLVLAVAIFFFGPVGPLALAVFLIFYATYRMATKPRAKWMHAGLPIILLALILAPVLAFAQTTITSTAPSDTTINVGQLLAPWLQGLIAAAVAVIMALFGWITTAINKRAGLEGNAAVMQMEEYARNALDSGLTTAAGWIIMKAGPSLDKMSFDVKSPLIVQGVTVLNNLAGDAIAKFGLTPDDLAKKLIAKIGVVTAANPSVAPSTTVSAPTA